jgi:agmatine deiminase
MKISVPPLDYRMPAEFSPHRATWIAWPHNKKDWPGKFAPIPWVYVEIVRHLSSSESVRIIVEDAAMEAAVRRHLTRSGVVLDRVEFYHFPTNRIWARDHGPIFIKKVDKPSQRGLTNWRFNAWAKYPDWEKDNAIPDRIARQFKLKQWKPCSSQNRKKEWVVLEGGSIDVNGAGAMLTTEECLLSEVQQRNPGLTRNDLETIFGNYLGIRKVIWLKNGITGDDTHGHVDDLARFVNPATVVAVDENNPRDENYPHLKENLKILKKATDQEGRPLKIVSLPMPGPIYFDGMRLPASYANFYIANTKVLVPTFNDPHDRVALNILDRLFPGREVVGIHSVDLVLGQGTLHCLTQQEPV